MSWVKYNIMWQRLLVAYDSSWFSPGSMASFTNKSDRYNVTKILLKVVLNIMIITLICYMQVLN
jgi:hypothetical protein